MKDDDLNNKEEEIIGHIPQHKKAWYSITKFEKYPDMATEGVGRAFGYLSWLILVFSIIIAIGLCIKFRTILNDEIRVLNDNFSEISYNDGKLNIVTANETNYTDIGIVIFNTQDLTDEQIKKYDNTSNNKTEIIWLKQRVILKIGGNTYSYYYKDILDRFNINQFDKQKLIVFLTNKFNSPQIYIFYFIAMIIYTFIAYFISTLLEALILSIFGMLTTLIAGIKIRYRAVFNMSIYAYTLSTFLQLIYIYIGIFTNFNIKYFDLMYTTIAFISLAAAIFMIKSDIIKQQLQLMKIIEIKKQQQDELTENKEDETKNNKEEENKEENKDKKEDKESKEGLDTGTQSGEA